METNTETASQNVEREVQSVAPKADLSLLSQADWLSDNVNNTKAEETKPAVEEKKEVVIAETSELALDKPEGETVKEGEGKTEEVTAEEKPLTLEEDTPLTLEAEATNTDDGWKAIGKIEELELETDSYEEFKVKLVEKETAPLRAELETLRTQSEEALFRDVDPRIRLNYELAKTGMSLEQIEAPLRNLEAFKAMGTAELIRADIEARYPNAESTWIDAEVEKQIESGNAAHEETRIRLELDAMEKHIIAEREQKIEQYKVSNEKFLAEKRDNEVAAISKALNEMSEFMGQPLSPEAKKGLADRYSSGKYDQILNDPAKRAELITYIELGKKAHEQAVTKSYNKGKLEITKHLHNTPPLENGGAGRVTTEETKGKSPLDKLEQAFG
jgi:hypothetical protein